MAQHKITLAALAVTLSLSTAPVGAFEIVFDPDNFTKAVEQVRNQVQQLDQMRDQLAEAKKLYESVNDFKSIEDVAQLLDQDEIRRYLPANFGDYEKLLTGSGSGDLADRISSIRKESRVDGYTAGDFFGQALERQGQRAARSQGIGEAIYETAEDRLKGLEELRGSIDSSDSMAELTAISTRLQAEQAILQNDLMRMQGLNMVQQAEERTARQTLKEKRRQANAQNLEVIRSWRTR